MKHFKFTAFILALSLAITTGVQALADEGEISSEAPGGSGETEPYVFTLAEQMTQEAQEEGTDYNGYIFSVRSDISTACEAEDIEGIEKVEYSGNLFTAETIDDIRNFISEDYVEQIEPNYILELYDADSFTDIAGDEITSGKVTADSAADPNDRYYSEYQYNIRDLDITDIWEYGLEGQDIDDSCDLDHNGIYDDDPIVIAVIDSGLKQGHEDIDWSRIIEGQDFTGNGSTNDSLGHGTFVTGQITAIKDNSLGIAGIGQNIYVMPLRVFEDRSAETSVIVSAINYAVQQRTLFDSTQGTSGVNVSVINMSLGGESSETILKNAVQAAIDAGIIVICSAGNDGDTTASYPAQYAIGVGSTNSSGAVSSYSQRLSTANGSDYANKVWVSCPGEDIVSCYYESTSSYVQASGTSFSGPEVAALAAFCKGIDNTIDHDAFKQLLKETAQFKTSGLGTISGQDVGYGWGTVSFRETINSLIGNMEGEAELKVSVVNEAGTVIPDAKYAIYNRNQDGSRGSQVLPDSSGVYTIDRGTKYIYTASAPKYEDQEGEFAVLTASRNLTITLEGQTYVTRIFAWNTRGEYIPDAEVTVTDSNGVKISRSSDGSFGTKNGEYRYSINAGGYFEASGNFTVNDIEDDTLERGNVIQVTMLGDIDVCSVKFEAAGADGSNINKETYISLYDSEGNEQEVYSDGYYKLTQGNYTYKAVNSTYTDVTGEICISEDYYGTYISRNIHMVDGSWYVYLDVMPLTAAARASVIVTDGSGQEQIPLSGYDTPTYKLMDGTYRYRVSAPLYNTYTGTFTVNGKKTYVDIQMSKGSSAIDDGTGNDPMLIINNSGNTLAKLKEYSSERTVGTTVYTGITIADLKAHFTADVLQPFGAVVYGNDGSCFDLALQDFQDYMIIWESSEGSAFELLGPDGSELCDDVFRVAFDNHEHTELVQVITPASCTEAGENGYTCIECGETRTVPSQALGHDYADGKCTRCGDLQVYEGDTSITVGENEVTSAMMRQFTSAGYYTMISYSGSEDYYVEGITFGDLVDNFLPDLCVSSLKIVCIDGFEGSYPESVFDDAMIGWYSDTLNMGSYAEDNGLRVVIDEGASGDWVYSPYVITAVGTSHDYGEPVVVPATCSEKGYTYRTCNTCGHVDYYDYTDTSDAHDWEFACESVLTTCTQDGTGMYCCKNCGTAKFEQISAPGHDYVEGICSRCGDIRLMYDVNLDGTVDSKDLLIVRKAASGACKLTENQKKIAGISNDNDGSAADALQLKKAIADGME